MKFYYQSSLGTIIIEGSEKGISRLVFSDDKEIQTEMTSHETVSGKKTIENEIDNKTDSAEMTSHWKKELDQYFNKSRKTFDLELDLYGTGFQKRVWGELLKIPFGQTITYKELALKLGDIRAIRAVAAANGKNPVSIIVPCHRVIGSDGSLTGYAGGLWRKQWLLNFERGDILFSAE